jgi:hypothetical protein
VEKSMSGRQVSGVTIAAVVRDAASVTLGLASLAVQAVDHQLHMADTDMSVAPQGGVPQQPTRTNAATVVDTFIGGAMLAARGTARAVSITARSAQALTRPVTSRFPIESWLDSPRMRAITDVGQRGRLLAENEAGLLTRRLVGQLVLLVLDQLDLTHEVLTRVDLDAVVKSVDLDAAVGRVDLDAVVDRVDLDRAVRHVDLDAVVDLVDLNRAVRHVDLDAVIATVNIDAVIDRIDLVDLAGEIIAALDLPEIIRGSSGSMATEMIRDARVQSMAADEAVSRVVDRLLLRRRPRNDQPDEVQE